MGVNIHIPADEVWSFFQKNKDRCTKEMVIVAENTDTKYEVCLTEDNGYPSFVVCKGDGTSEYEEGAISENDCTYTAWNCYRRYLFPVAERDGRTYVLGDGNDEAELRQQMEDIVYEREDELRLALYDFLQVVLKGSADEDSPDILDMLDDDMLDTLLDFFLEFLADFGINVWRPTI